MANLLDRSSLVLTPTAYNNGEALCIKPDDGSGDFQFSRNSAATRVNAQGLVENVQILSSNLVQNGDFSEEGVQEVSNGSFSQEGVEQADDSVISNAGGSIMTKVSALNYNATSDGTGVSIVRPRLQFNNITIGKSYRIRITPTNQSGTIDFKLYDGSQYIISGNDLTTDVDLYFKAEGTNVFIAFDGTNIFNVDFEISLKEVGQDWDLGTGWSIGEDKAVATNASLNNLTSNQSLTIGKTYKITFTIFDYVKGKVRYRGNSTTVGQARSANGTYTEYLTTTASIIRLQALTDDGGFTGSVTNISVKEVGMDWSLVSADASIGDSKLVCDNVLDNTTIATQLGVVPTQKSVILKYDVIVNSGSFRMLVGSGGTTTVVTTSGTYTFYETSGTGGNLNLQARSGGFDGSVTNISVIEISTDTNLPRINYEGFSYQDALGSELITNGDFDTDSDWNKTSAVIENGKATINVLNGAYASIVQTPISYVSGKTYILKATIQGGVGSSGNQMKFQDNGNNSGGLSLSNGGVTLNESIQNFEVQWVANANSTNLVISRNTNSGNYSFSIDNVSVKEYLGQEVVPNSGCGSWLWEPQSTNLFVYSEDFSSSWVKTDCSVVSNFGVSPSGNTDADKLTFTTTNTLARAQYNLGSLTTGNTYTQSYYIKSLGTDITLRIGTSGSNAGEFVDIIATSEWQRFEFTSNASATTEYPRVQNITGALGVEILVWGAQFEEQSYATSYIPTSGSQVTRNQDVCTNGGSLATINSTEGVLYAEIAALADDGTNRYITLNSGIKNDSVRIYYNSLSQNQISMQVRSTNAVQAIYNHTLSDVRDFIKVAILYKLNEFKMYVNGSLVYTDTSGLTPIGLSELDFDSAGAEPFFGKTKALAVFPYLSDQELTELTTI